jgi:hypothetical protein
MVIDQSDEDQQQSSTNGAVSTPVKPRELEPTAGENMVDLTPVSDDSPSISVMSETLATGLELDEADDSDEDLL